MPKWPVVTIQKDTTAEGGWYFVEPGAAPREAAHIETETYIPTSALLGEEAIEAAFVASTGEGAWFADDKAKADYGDKLRKILEAAIAAASKEGEA